MIFADAMFYVFSAILLLSACMVITARNPVHSVLFLILAFINAAALFVLAGAEFLAMVLVIVYVGAVAVLFLFVVMMLDVDFTAMREGVQRYAPVGMAVGFILMIEIGLIVTGWVVAPGAGLARLAPMQAGMPDTRALGELIYTRYVFLFELTGLLLLIAMIGAIVLTHTGKKAPRQQDVAAQHARLISETFSVVPMEIGAGATIPEAAPPGGQALPPPSTPRRETA